MENGVAGLPVHEHNESRFVDYLDPSWNVRWIVDEYQCLVTRTKTVARDHLDSKKHFKLSGENKRGGISFC